MGEPDLQAIAARTLLEFGAALRAAGLRTDLNCMRSLFAALEAFAAPDLRALHLCGRLTLCGSEDEVRRYDRCFADFFFSRAPQTGAMPVAPDQRPAPPRGAEIPRANPGPSAGFRR